MILGVALVVDELNKGQRLVYRYPESVPNSLPNNASRGLRKLYDQYFSISQDNFAKLFRPKNVLLNRVLSLTIDDLQFTGYPCPLGSEAVSPVASSDAELQSTSTSSGPLSHYVISMFNIVIVSVTGKAMKKINPEIPYRCQLKHSNLPGIDPVAVALGLRESCCGICSQSLKRVIESISLELCDQEKKSRYLSEQVAILLHLIDVVNSSTNRRDNPLVHSIDGVGALQLSSAASRDSTEDEMRGGSRNLNSLLEEQAGLRPSVPPSQQQQQQQQTANAGPVFVVASFDRTTRSASSASAASVLIEGGDSSSLSVLQPSTDEARSSSTSDPQRVLTISMTSGVGSGGCDLQYGGPISPFDRGFDRGGAGGGGSRGLAGSEIQLPVQEHRGRHEGSSSTSSSSHGWGLHLLTVALKNSSLANELRLFYHSLVSGPCVSMSFNSVSRCSLSRSPPLSLACADLKHCEDYRKYCCSSRSTAAGGGGGLTGDQKVLSSLRLSASQSSLNGGGGGGNRPRSSFSGVGGGSLFGGSGVSEMARRCGINLETDTLLPLADPEVMLSLLKDALRASSSMEDDVVNLSQARSESYYGENNCRLYAFVELLDPTLSFIEMSLSLNEPIEELLSMTTLLVCWGLAEVVSLLSYQSVFRVHEKAPTEGESRAAHAFESLLLSLRVDFNEVVPVLGGTPPASSTGAGGAGGGMSAAAAGSAAGVRKSTSYSSVPAAPVRVRADSDGNIKSSTSSSSSASQSVSDLSSSLHPTRRNPQSTTSGASTSVTSSSTSSSSGAVGTHPSSTVITVRRDPVPSSLSLDGINLVPPRFSLCSVLALFDGSKTLKELIWLMERPLQRHIGAIVVFLLRWHMLVEVQSVVINCARLSSFDLEELKRCTPQAVGSSNSISGAGHGHYSSAGQAIHRWSSLGSALESSRPGPSAAAVDFGGGVSRFSQQETADQLVTNAFIQQLTSKELAVYDKLSPHLQGGVICSKMLSELLWSCQVTETEWSRLLPKLPHLKILKRDKP